MADQPTACVLGLGLIGGSIASALTRSGQYRAVIGWDINADSTARALADGHITQIGASPADSVHAADLVILGMYVQGIIDNLQSLADHFKAGALIIDVGSTKERIITAMNTLPPTVYAVGGHPMAGKTTSGVTGISADLFTDRIFILTPTARADEAVMTRARSVIESLGAHVIIMNADEHDRQVAIISHIMRLIPIAIAGTAQATGDPITWTLAAGSFRESTRAVTSDLGFWEDVLTTNTNGIPQALRALSQQLQQLANLIESGDVDGVIQRNEAARQAWLRRYNDE